MDGESTRAVHCKDDMHPVNTEFFLWVPLFLLLSDSVIFWPNVVAVLQSVEQEDRFNVT